MHSSDKGILSHLQCRKVSTEKIVPSAIIKRMESLPEPNTQAHS